MPKLADIMFREQGPDGARYEEMFPCSVDARNGSFSITVDEEIWSTAKHMQQAGQLKGMAFSTKFVADKPKYLIHGNELENLKRNVQQVIATMLETTVTRAPVIQYAMATTCHFWEMPDGSILPNGGFDPHANREHPDKGYWTKANQSTKGGPYGVTIYARVAMKETHTNRSGKVTHKYLNIDTRDFPDCVAKLNGFTHMLPDGYKPLQEMPYTDEAGEFFFNMINGMCLLAQRMFAFFQDDSALQKAIENKAGIGTRLTYTGV